MPLNFLLKTAIVFLVGCLPLYAQQYVPNDNLRNQIRSDKWTVLKEKTPSKYRFTTGLVLKTNQCFDLYEQVAKKLGYPKDEVASMMTFRNVILMETDRGQNFSKAEIDAEYRLVSNRYITNAKERDWSPEELQKEYDPLLLEAIWVATMNQFSKGKSQEIQQIAHNLLKANNTNKEEIIVEKTKKTTSSKLPKIPDKKRKIINSNTWDVEDIILRTVTNYGLNGVYVDNEVSVLFTNGEILTNPIGAIDELDVKYSKGKYPKRWNTWVKKNNVLYVTKAWKNKTYDWKKWFDVRPASANQRLTGKFNTSDAFGGASVINASTVFFDDKGRFVWKTVKGGDTSWKPMYSKSNEAGTYVLKDYKIVLTYNNGVEESFFFAFYPKDNKHFVIGTSHFVPVKSKLDCF